ncbi:putative peroxidase [Helianthus anomalus]
MNKALQDEVLVLFFEIIFYMMQGCDASILLDQTSTIDSEKSVGPNTNSARGFEVVDKIKDEVDKVCGRQFSEEETQPRLTPTSQHRPWTYPRIKKLRGSRVVLSGAHTLGFAQCRTFRPHIYSDTNIDPAFASHLRTICPQVGGDSTLTPLDPTPSSFDEKYFTNLVSKKGLLNSDQALFSGGETLELVSKYSGSHEEFWEDFAESMICWVYSGLFMGHWFGTLSSHVFVYGL